MKKLFPFEGAIFDLDGTLLDSMYVWAHIDEVFFEKRGMTAPEDYGRALAGKSYRESAEYTIARFGFAESWEEIVAEWTQMAIEEYSHHVKLKPCAREYLLALKDGGVKLAVATALPEYLYRPCLENLGILDWFDALCSTDETGGRGKAGGEVFLLAARRLGLEAEKCAVFEDVYEGVSGAKYAGMRAYCVKDDASRHTHEKSAEIADGMIDCFSRILPRCVIFTAMCEGELEKAYVPREGDFVLCADAGYGLAREMGIEPDVIIGDFDSAEAPERGNIIRHPVMKDDTDTMLCIKYGLEAGYRNFLIVGGLGGRLDHTLANLQSLSYLAERGARAEICDGRMHGAMLRRSSICIPATKGKLSLFAMGGTCEGVFSRGTKYDLENAVLTPDFPLGMGNDFKDEYALISVEKGRLLVLWENE